MFDALRARLQSLADAPERARELAASRLTARCRTGRVEAVAEGLRVVVRPKEHFITPAWAAEINAAITDALKEGGS